MGACTSKNGGSGKKVYETAPEDVLDCDPKDPYTLDFEANLSNVKLENLSDSLKEESFWMEFKLPEIITITCPTAQVNNNKLKV